MRDPDIVLCVKKDGNNNVLHEELSLDIVTTICLFIFTHCYYVLLLKDAQPDAGLGRGVYCYSSGKFFTGNQLHSDNYKCWWVIYTTVIRQ